MSVEIMHDGCEFLSACGFLNNVRANSELIKDGWISMYCKSGERSERCKRKHIRKKTGHPPIDHMAPTGEIIKTIKLD
jgi:hypothetical protein